jgi:ABC-type glutathione transport system ATPase component
MALLLISHDLGLLARHCDRLAILDGGHVIESGPTPTVLAAPKSAAGQVLVAAAQPHPGFPGRTCGNGRPVLTFHGVEFRYATGVGVHDFSLEVRTGECVGLVGPSGAGKSTVAKLALGLLRPTQGEVWLLGHDLATLRGAALRQHRRESQLIFQDPFAALPFHRPVQEIVAEPLRLAGVTRQGRVKAVVAALAEAGLQPPDKYAERYVDSLSGGERQRVALARAVISQPQLIVADEPTSMLDAPAKWAWLERLAALQQHRDLAVLLITHDLAQARALCDRIAVLEQGRLMRVFPSDRGSI